MNICNLRSTEISNEISLRNFSSDDSGDSNSSCDIVISKMKQCNVNDLVKINNNILEAPKLVFVTQSPIKMENCSMQAELATDDKDKNNANESSDCNKEKSNKCNNEKHINTRPVFRRSRFLHYKRKHIYYRNNMHQQTNYNHPYYNRYNNYNNYHHQQHHNIYNGFNNQSRFRTDYNINASSRFYNKWRYNERRQIHKEIIYNALFIIGKFMNLIDNMNYDF